MDTILKLHEIISKGHYSAKENLQELRFLFSTHGLMILYFVPSFMKISLIVLFMYYLCIRVVKIFIRKISKGHNSANIVGGVEENVGEVMVLFLCTPTDGGMYL